MKLSPGAHEILLLPGSSGLGAFWDPIRSHLGDDTTRTTDWPGLGGTPAQPGITTFEDLVDFTIAQISTPVVLVGQSLGGYVAMRVALSRPDLITHLVLVATSAGVDRDRLGLPEFRPSATELTWTDETSAPLDDQLAELVIPTLLLWASDDAISPIAIGERINELLPHSRLVVFESTDHWMVHDYPDAVASEIAAWARSDK